MPLTKASRDHLQGCEANKNSGTLAAAAVVVAAAVATVAVVTTAVVVATAAVVVAAAAAVVAVAVAAVGVVVVAQMCKRLLPVVLRRWLKCLWIGLPMSSPQKPLSNDGGVKKFFIYLLCGRTSTSSSSQSIFFMGLGLFWC